MPYDAITFDFDGVIMDLPPESFQEHLDDVVERALARMEIDESHPGYDPFADAIWDRDIDRLQDVAATHDMDHEDVWTIKETVSFERQQEQIAAGERTFYDDITALPELADHCDIGVFSNNQHALIDYALQQPAPQLNGTGSLDQVVTAYYGIQPTIDDHANRKPDPSYINHIQDELDADRMLYVGDKPIDITAAYRAGVDAAFIQRPYHGDLDTIPTGIDGNAPTYTLDSLHDLVPLVTENQDG